MEEEQLNGLALLHVHRDKEVPFDKIFHDFAKMKARRLKVAINLERNDYNPAESRSNEANEVRYLPILRFHLKDSSVLYRESALQS